MILALALVLAVAFLRKRISLFRSQATVDPVTKGLNSFGFFQQAGKCFAGRDARYAFAVLQLALGIAVFGVAAFGVGVPLVPVSLAALYHVLSIILLIRTSLGFRYRISSEISDGEEADQLRNDRKGAL